VLGTVADPFKIVRASDFATLSHCASEKGKTGPGFTLILPEGAIAPTSPRIETCGQQ